MTSGSRYMVTLSGTQYVLTAAKMIILFEVVISLQRLTLKKDRGRVICPRVCMRLLATEPLEGIQGKTRQRSWDKCTAYFHAGPHLSHHSVAGRNVVTAGEPSKAEVASGSKQERDQLYGNCTRWPHRAGHHSLSRMKQTGSHWLNTRSGEQSKRKAEGRRLPRRQRCTDKVASALVRALPSLGRGAWLRAGSSLQILFHYCSIFSASTFHR